MNLFEHEVMKIRFATRSITSGLSLISLPVAGPCDLTAYDLRRSEEALRDAAHEIGVIRSRIEEKERDAFHNSVKSKQTVHF